MKQKEIIIGTLLGDGFLQKRGQKARLRICHSYKQKEYVDWKYIRLKSLCTRTQPPKVQIQEAYQLYLFSTQCEEILVPFHKLFYENREGRYKKRICPDLGSYLQNPLSLAVWWLDNGSARADCSAGRFATQSYTLSEHKLLQKVLMENYSIQTAIVRHTAKKSKIQYTLSVPAKGGQFQKLIDTIRPLVCEIPSLKYKLGKPRND